MACEKMEGRRGRVNWCELPAEILWMIGQRLDSSVDVLRFRGVCKLWRASLPPFQHLKPRPLPLLKFPCPFASGDGVFLSETTIYRLQSSPLSPSSTSIPSNSCLLKLEETHSGKPFFARRVYQPWYTFPKDISLLEFGMVKLGKAYGLRYPDRFYSMSEVSKVIRYPDSPSSMSIFVIYDGGKLGYAKIGDPELTLLDDHDPVTDYHDMIIHKGKPYVVDKWGTISCIDDSSLELTQISPPSIGLQLQLLGSRKHLVESCGELYLVDRHLDPHGDTRPKQRGSCRYRPRIAIDYERRVVSRSIISGKTIDFKVYRVGTEFADWVEVTNFGDRSFLLSDDLALSVSTSEIHGCKANCIYFKDRPCDNNLFSFRRFISVFNLEDRSITHNQWSTPIQYSNLHLNSKFWILDCSVSSGGTT